MDSDVQHVPHAYLDGLQDMPLCLGVNGILFASYNGCLKPQCTQQINLLHIPWGIVEDSE